MALDNTLAALSVVVRTAIARCCGAVAFSMADNLAKAAVVLESTIWTLGATIARIVRVASSAALSSGASHLPDGCNYQARCRWRKDWSRCRRLDVTIGQSRKVDAETLAVGRFACCIQSELGVNRGRITNGHGR